jgi:hypothetical protein
MQHEQTNVVRFAREPSTSSLAYLAEAKTADRDGKFGPIVVIDGVGDFPAKQLEDVISALINLHGNLPATVSGFDEDQADIVRLPIAATPGDRFGGCPTCGMTNGFVNDGADHWFVCDSHHTKWYVGSNLFSCWREDTAEDRARNRYLLGTYQQVKAVYNEPEISG